MDEESKTIVLEHFRNEAKKIPDSDFKPNASVDINAVMIRQYEMSTEIKYLRNEFKEVKNSAIQKDVWIFGLLAVSVALFIGIIELTKSRSRRKRKRKG